MKGSLKKVFTGAGLVVMNLLQATAKIGISWRVEQPYSSNLLFYARHPFFVDFLNWHSPVARIIAGALLVLAL